MNNWTVTKDEAGERLLSFIRKRLPQLKTIDIRWSIEHHRCHLNGQIERFCSKRLQESDRIVFHFEEKMRLSFQKERLLFEDQWLFIYNKPFAFSMDCLATIICHHQVHRLDRDTTGVVLFAKDESTRSSLEALFRRRVIKKTYLAIVHGVPKREGTIENYLAPKTGRTGEIIMGVTSHSKGLYSCSHWKTQGIGDGCALVQIEPQTGRTHQIRVHLSTIGHPIAGDLRYGERKQNHRRPLLHAHELQFTHPMTAQPIKISAPIPTDFLQAIDDYDIKYQKNFR